MQCACEVERQGVRERCGAVLRIKASKPSLMLTYMVSSFLQVEKLNSAMKEGVLRMIKEEEGEKAALQEVSFNTRSSGSGSGGGSEEGGGTLSEYLSFALSCATGYQEQPSSSSSASSGIRWNPTSPTTTSSRR